MKHKTIILVVTGFTFTVILSALRPVNADEHNKSVPNSSTSQNVASPTPYPLLDYLLLAAFFVGDRDIRNTETALSTCAKRPNQNFRECSLWLDSILRTGMLSEVQKRSVELEAKSPEYFICRQAYLKYKTLQPLAENRSCQEAGKYLRRGEYFRAQIEFESCLRNDPENTDIYYGLSLAFEGQGENRISRGCYTMIEYLRMKEGLPSNSPSDGVVPSKCPGNDDCSG